VAIVQRVIPASADQVFAVLSDGWTYSDWVVGTVHIRSVDADYPAPGSLLHHKVGPWPFSLRDNTKVIRCDPPHELVVQARLRPLGVATVTLRLRPDAPDRTTVTMMEEFAAGPLQWIQTKINDLLLHQRNKEALRRLSDIVVGRARTARVA
jgi:uncharacterized protein YndB with AHSA1/START domain